MQELAIEPKSELSLASVKISTGIAAFESKKAELQELADSATGLEISSIDDKAGIKAVSEKRKELKAARVEITKQGKEMRDGLTKISREISAKEKDLIAIIEPTEDALLVMEAKIEAEKERIRQEEIAKEEARIQSRIDALAEYGYQIDYSDIKSMSDETFDKYKQSAKVQFEKEQAEKAAAEKLRLEQEEADRLAREEEARKLAADRKELEELRAKQAEAQRIIDKKKAEVEAEAARLAKEKADAEAAKLREEQQKKKDEELRIAKELAAKEAAAKAIKDAKEAEEKRLELLKKKEARRPDKEKLAAFSASLSTLVGFEVKTDEAKVVVIAINEMAAKMQAYINQKLENL